MRIFVKNQDGIEEEVNANVIRLEPNDVVAIKLAEPDMPKQDLQEYVNKFRDVFPHNKIIFVRDESDISIIRQGGNVNEAL